MLVRRDPVVARVCGMQGPSLHAWDAPADAIDAAFDKSLPGVIGIAVWRFAKRVAIFKADEGQVSFGAEIHFICKVNDRRVAWTDLMRTYHEHCIVMPGVVRQLQADHGVDDPSPGACRVDNYWCSEFTLRRFHVCHFAAFGHYACHRAVLDQPSTFFARGVDQCIGRIAGHGIARFGFIGSQFDIVYVKRWRQPFHIVFFDKHYRHADHLVCGNICL